MLIIEIKALDNGAHRNQNGSVMLEGWAVIPPDVGTAESLENFPFGDITVEEVNGVPTVTNWVPLPMPDPESVKPETTQLDLIESQITYTAMMTDTLLGV